MKKLRKFLATPGVSLCALALGILLLGTSTVGGARAAITYYSDPYQANVQLQQIQVQLNENGKAVDALALRGKDSEGNAFDLTDPATTLKLGYAYPEALSVTNPASSGNTTNIPEYVRVTIQRYWEKPAADANSAAEKQPALNESLIQIGLTQNSGWIEDADAHTDERIVLYYTKPLAPGETTPNFVDTLTIDPAVSAIGTREQDGTIKYTYNGMNFCLKVKVDAIQNNNAQDAALSAWGRAVTIAPDGTLSLG